MLLLAPSHDAVCMFDVGLDRQTLIIMLGDLIAAPAGGNHLFICLSCYCYTCAMLCVYLHLGGTPLALGVHHHPWPTKICTTKIYLRTAEIDLALTLISKFDLALIKLFGRCCASETKSVHSTLKMTSTSKEILEQKSVPQAPSVLVSKRGSAAKR